MSGAVPGAGAAETEVVGPQQEGGGLLIFIPWSSVAGKSQLLYHKQWLQQNLRQLHEQSSRPVSLLECSQVLPPDENSFVFSISCSLFLDV